MSKSSISCDCGAFANEEDDFECMACGRIYVVCTQCGDGVLEDEAHFDNDGQAFCSNKCKIAHQTM
jgi:hypothetical protein